MNKQIQTVSIVFAGLFLLLIANLSYLVMVQGPSLRANPANTRSVEEELSIQRGSITSSDGVLLAESRPTATRFERVYPKGRLAAHVLGYWSEKYQKAGIEQSYNSILLGREDVSFLDQLINKFKKPEGKGNNLVLTIDSRIQAIAEQDLEGRKGAAVAIDPKSGAVLAMASSPTYDPGSIDDSWKTISADPNAPLVNRATQGKYPPGSSFKIITSSAALQEKLFDPSSPFTDEGTLEVQTTQVRNYDGKTFGDVTFREALELSINTVFAQIGLKLGAQRLVDYADAFGFNQTIDFDIPLAESSTKKAAMMDDVDVAWTAIGQARTVATPMEMALAASAIANNGTMMKPYLVKEIRDPTGQIIKQADNHQIREVISAITAQTVNDMMVGVVENGTGAVVQIPGVRVAGKTGTAETGVGAETHGWFVAFAPADNPQIAIAVIVEQGGTGGSSAGPIVHDMLEQALRK